MHSVEQTSSAIDQYRRPQFFNPGPNNELGQNDFLALMIAQLKNQDPTSPMESADFLSQLAQFGTVQGIEELKSTFSSLAASLTSGQTLDAVNLVGKNVIVPSEHAYADGSSGFDVVVHNPTEGGSVKLIIKNEAGEEVGSVFMSEQDIGEVTLEWDGQIGVDDNGEPIYASEGIYSISAVAKEGDTSEAIPTFVVGEVSSVNLNPFGGQLEVELTGLGSFLLNEIRRIS